MHPLLHSGAQLSGIATKGSVFDAKLRNLPAGEHPSSMESPARSGRRNMQANSNPDSFQMPNRPLKRGENLLDFWDKAQAK